MKRPRCTTCRHTMKGHKRSKCNVSTTLLLSDGSTYIGSTHADIPFGKGKQQMANGNIYKGDFINGLRQGKGVLTTKKFIYNGDWEKNLFHGDGKITYTSGESYNGSFKKGFKNGFGCFIQTPAYWYRGDWLNNIRHGQGIEKSEDGLYNGDFQFGKKHGHGSITYNNGSTYEGKWLNNVRQGFGILKTLYFYYNGHWSNNKFHGSGKLVCEKTGVYTGKWKYGLRHKKGCQIYTNADVYNGNWSKNKRCGQGTLKMTNGDIYKGSWVNDMKNGLGTMETSSFCYKGEWLDNQKEGSGSITINNYTLKGYWVKNKRHGIFEKVGLKKEKQLWIRNEHLVLKNIKTARKQIVKLLKLQDYEATKWASSFFPKVATWKFIIKYDIDGILVFLKDKTSICTFLKDKCWPLFKKKKYALIKACVNQLPDTILIVAMEHDEAKILFDCLTDEFEPNPWIVSKVSYSKNTRDKLLKGLHLGDFGRCNPIDPFTRQQLTPSSGTFLSSNLKHAKHVWDCFKECLTKRVTVRRLAYEFNITDYEELLNNARETNDMNTLRTIMKERDDYIIRERSLSLCEPSEEDV